MFVKKMQVEHYRGIKNLDVGFHGPEGDENVVNVLIGKNGSGKTTVLEMISNWFRAHERNLNYGKISIENGPDFQYFSEIQDEKYDRKYTTNLNNEISSLTANDTAPFSYPQFIYLPALVEFSSTGSSTPVSLTYQLSTTIKNDLLSRTSDYITAFVIANEREQNEADAAKRAEKAVGAFNKPFSSLNLSTRLSGLDAGNFNAPLFSNVDGEEFPIDRLSDGEKQIYARMVGLMMLKPKNSVILIDEPEIAIHPAWQYRILDIYKKIGSANQLIVATHSAQILSSVPWQSIQVISRSADATTVSKLAGPPSGIDSESILGEIMGAEFYHPKLYKLKEEYRELFDKGEANTPPGLKLKEKLESLESRDSEFFQELRLIEKLRKGNDENDSQG